MELVKLAILNKVPIFQSSIDFVERAADGPCRGKGNLKTDDWIDMEQVLATRYEVTMRSVNPSSLRVTNRVSFVARPNATRTPIPNVLCIQLSIPGLRRETAIGRSRNETPRSEISYRQ